MLKKYKYQFYLLVAIIIGGIVVFILLNSYYKSIDAEQNDYVEERHAEVVSRANKGIEVYAAIVSALRSYLVNSEEFPTEKQYQSFLKDLLRDLDFNNRIIVNYVDTTQVFRYVFTPDEIDPFQLKGINAKDFRPPEEIIALNDLMYQDDITIFRPINLREGWAGLPFNFSAKDSNGNVHGYIATVIDLKYLLDYFYTAESKGDFVHSFRVEDSIDITREAVYDGTQIYNTERDIDYYKNFRVRSNNFLYSTISYNGLKLTIGSAYKKQVEPSNLVTFVTILWYTLLSTFSMIALMQYVRNTRLTERLQLANKNIEEQNIALESSIFKIQTLIKEVHHRVKNNMQMIANLLSLQQDEYEDEKVIFALEQAKNRVQSMALVHQKLYGSSNLEDVNTKEYIEKLIDFIDDTLQGDDIIPAKNISIAEDLIFDAETMASLGLIINELITNSYKYAFKSGNDNFLELSIVQDNDRYKMTYSDSGPGLPDDFNFETSDSLGMQLIYILTDQLNGELKYTNAEKSLFTIYFDKAEELA
ncbi:MAG: sensor histidine kinase [Winogradskyella sp.]|nr:sensor histidine kinase [Winogradskyella sp.]